MAIEQKGFTLIELLVVIALMGLLTLFAIPSISSFFKLSMGTTAREMASIIKEAYNSAVMTGKVHRLVYDLKTGEYWVESGPNSLLLDTSETRELEERRKKFSRHSEGQKPPSFSLEKTVTKSKHVLPRGVEFDNILTEQSKEPFSKEGKAYTHIFPHGFTERTLIHLKDSSDHKATLILFNLSGKSRYVDRTVDEGEAYAN